MLMLAACLDVHMTDMSAEQQEVAKLEKEAKEMMEEANRRRVQAKARRRQWLLLSCTRKRRASCLLLVHPFAGMHINVRCQAAKYGSLVK